MNAQQERKPAQALSDAVLKAKERHGKPFSYEKGSDWKPHDTPVLTQWIQSRGREAK